MAGKNYTYTNSAFSYCPPYVGVGNNAGLSHSEQQLSFSASEQRSSCSSSSSSSAGVAFNGS